MTVQAPPGQPGWLPDPTGRFESRYWDGTSWTQAVMKNGEVDTDPEAQPSVQSSGPSILPDPPAPEQTMMPHVAPPAASDRFTSLPAAEAQARLSQMLPMAGVTLTRTAPGRIDGMLTVKGKRSFAAALFWYGLIYWWVKSRPVKERFSLVFVPAATGTRISIQGSPKVIQVLVPVIGQLPW